MIWLAVYTVYSVAEKGRSLKPKSYSILNNSFVWIIFQQPTSCWSC